MSARFIDAWKDAWGDPALRVQLVLTPPLLVATLAALSAFLVRVEERHGATIPDPVLAALPPRDCTWLAFGVIYLALAIGLAVLLRHPRDLVIGLQAYVVMIAARICVMHITPLDPPPDTIPLVDPIIEHVATGRVLTRDLFFSGHTATLFLLYLGVPLGRPGKAVLLACTAGVAVAVLWQHVHYTVDVLAAPPFAFASYALVRRLHTSRTMWVKRRQTHSSDENNVQPTGEDPLRAAPNLSTPGRAR